MREQFRNLHALLLSRISVAQSDGVFELWLFFAEGVEVDGDTGRCADFVLAAVAFADVVSRLFFA